MSAFTTLIAVLVAVWAVLREHRMARLALGLDVLLKFADRFESEPMCKARRQAAECLSAGDGSTIAPVMNFFDSLGLLLHRKALDEEFVWNTFAHWVLYWFVAAEPHIAAGREDDPNMWGEFGYLFNRMLSVEARKGGLTEAAVKATIAEFLAREVKWATERHDHRGGSSREAIGRQPTD